MKNIVLALLLAAPALFGAGDVLILRGGTVHPVSQPAIANGSVLVRDGRIAEVGVKVAAPKGARVIDVKGLHVYPGMIDSGTQIGLSEVGSVRETNDSLEIGDFNPQLRALIAVNPASEHIAVTRANGITSAITLPEGSLIVGQGALIHLDGWTWREMEVRESAFLGIHFPIIDTSSRRSSGGVAPRRTPYAEAKKTYEKRLQQLHEYFEDARRYQKAKAAALPGFEPDLKLEAMLPVIEGKLPALVFADRERAIRAALLFAEKEKIRIILAEAREAWKLAPELAKKKIPVILGPTLSLPAEEDDPYDKPFTTPAELFKAGVKFAFATFSTSASRNLPYEAAAAVGFGLPYDEALKAVTISAAEIWGVGGELGSIDKGKWADLIVTTGDPLETRTEVRHLFIKGTPVDLNNKHRRLYETFVNR